MDIQGLPLQGKKIFYKVYSKTNDLDLALAIVKKFYKKTSDTWTIKKSVEVKPIIKKSGLFSPNYFLELPITSVDRDNINDGVSLDLLQHLTENNLIDSMGDIDHLKLNGSNSFNGLFTLSDYALHDNKLIGRIQINKSHQHYKDFIKNGLLDRIQGISAEFYGGLKDKDNIITHADRLGWSIAIDTQPINPLSSI